MFALVGREEARAVHRLLAHEHRRQHRRVALLRVRGEREAVERDREERRVADAIAEARAREPRAALHLEPAVRVGELEWSRGSSRARRIADDLHLDGVLVRVAVRRPRSGGFGTRSSSVAPLRRGRELLLGGCSSSLTRVSSSSCSGVGLPFSFCAPRSSSTRGSSARQRSSAASSSSKTSAAPLRASAARKASGSSRAARRSIIAVESRSASSTWATPSSSAGGQTQSATAFTRACAFSTAMPKPAHSTSSTSFSPSPNAIVCSRVKPRCAARKSSPEPFVTPGRRELEEVRQRLRDVEAVAEALLHPRPRAVERVRVADADELRRRLGRASRAGRRPRGSRAAGSARSRSRLRVTSAT